MPTPRLLFACLLLGATAAAQVTLNVLGVSWNDPNAQYIKNSTLPNGVVYLVNWSDIDFGPNNFGGQYQFSTVDTKLNIDNWHGNNKTVNIIVWANSDSTDATCPSTGSGQNGTYNCSVPSYVWTNLGSSNITTCGSANQWMPNYLSSVWQQPYKAFMSALFGHYAGKLGYARVHIGHGGEGVPYLNWTDTSTTCGQAYANWGLTVSAWETYVLNMLTYESKIPTSIGRQMGITPFGTPPDSGPDQEAADAASLGFGFGSQGWTAADTKSCPGAIADWCMLFTKYPAVVHELQPLAPTCPSGNNCPGESGQVGPLPPLLNFAVAHGVTDVELFLADWLIAVGPANQYQDDYADALEAAK